jgi:hypothetical protein
MLAAEILILLVAPIAYYVLLAPKPQIGTLEMYPLTNDQIQTSWPNLPNADQIVKDGAILVKVPIPPTCANFTRTGMFGILGSSVMNATVLNAPDYHNGGVIPKSYDIWLQLNDTLIEVPNKYLATDNPPMTPPELGFLGTSLPTAYVILAVIVIVTTLAVGTSLVVRKRKLLSSN